MSTLSLELGETQSTKRSTQALDWGIATLVILRCAWIFGATLRSPDLPLRMAQDDFYYYLRPAQNLAWFHRATFFQQTLTNGYHPLYFALLTAMSLFVRTLPGVFRFLWVLNVLSASAIFLLVRKLFARIATPLLANALAVLITALSVTQICDQMEVTLTLPLGFAFLLMSFVPGREITPQRAASMGFLGALTFLSRLDAGLLVFFWVVGALCTREYRAALTRKVVLSFLAACLPLPLLYLWINQHFFATLLPISGMAKELRHGWAPSLLVPISFSGTSEILVFAALATAVLSWALRGFLQAREKVFFFVVLFTPFAFYATEMIVSDWPVWNWYFYALRFSAAGLAMLVAILTSRSVIPVRYPRLHAGLSSAMLASILCASGLLKLYVAKYRVDAVMVDIQQAAGVLHDFAKTHPGIYAMGDRAGMFAVESGVPVLQTEGLVMDRSYLEHIRREDNLRSVLSSYGVQYYVAYVFDWRLSKQMQGSCFHAMEPSIAGESALRMRADFCGTPLLQFADRDGQYRVYRVGGE